MTLAIDIDHQITSASAPTADMIRRWIHHTYIETGGSKTLGDNAADVEISLVVTDTETIRQLNAQFRGKDTSTNVLSFPSELEIIDGVKYLGDIAICAPIVQAEAEEQRKPTEAHWAHLITHGTLHLLGYDHIEESEAEIMESLETKLLAQLDYENPYAEY